MESQFLFKFRLADKHDLEELVLGGFEVRENAQLLHGLYGHVLRLVDQEHHRIAFLVLLDQEIAQPLQAREGRAAFSLHAEFVQHGFEQFFKGQRGVKEINGVQLLPLYLLHVGAEHRRLAGADLARDRDEALLLLHAVQDGGQGLLVAGAQIEKVWIGRDVKRFLIQTEEI